MVVVMTVMSVSQSVGHQPEIFVKTLQLKRQKEQQLFSVWRLV